VEDDDGRRDVLVPIDSPRSARSRCTVDAGRPLVGASNEGLMFHLRRGRGTSWSQRFRHGCAVV